MLGFLSTPTIPKTRPPQMTRPRRRNTRRERITGLALALLLLAGFWLLAATLKMSSAQQRQARVLQELALERIVLPEVVAKTERPRSPVQASPPMATAEREDMQAFGEDALLEGSLPETAELERRVSVARQEVELLHGIDPVPGRTERFRLSDELGPGTPGRHLPSRSTRASGRDDGRISLAGRLPEGQAFEERGSHPALADDDTMRPIQRRETPPDLPAIERGESMTGLAEDALDVDDLIRWMMLRPGELPSGIKRHVDWRQDNLTSKAVIEHEGETYELYLMARVPIREIHVVLVKGLQTYYLIDRSFQHEGRKFRTGTVRRSEALITGVVSEERAAASPEAAHFYNVFLSWWQRERLRL